MIFVLHLSLTYGKCKYYVKKEMPAIPTGGIPQILLTFNIIQSF